MKDYYYILGVDPNASLDEIKKAYRKLSVKFHPDKNKGDKFFEDRFKDIQEAYETLYNKNKRILYDSAYKRYKSGGQYDYSDTRNQENGEIVSFDASKYNVSNDDEITFFWATKNITNVKLSCYSGSLPPSGKKTIKINSPKSRLLNISLTAFDKYGKTTSKSIKVNYTKKADAKYKKEEAGQKESVKKENPVEINNTTDGFDLTKLFWILFTGTIIIALLIYLNNTSRKVEHNFVNTSTSKVQLEQSTSNLSSEESLLLFLELVNNQNYNRAYSMSNNTLWNSEDYFKNIAWGNLRNIVILSTPRKKYYESKWNADEILNLKFSAIDTDLDEIRNMDYDFHMSKQNGKWKVVRMIYDRPSTPDGSLQKKIDELFDVKEFLSDESAICYFNTYEQFKNDDFHDGRSSKATFRVTYKEYINIRVAGRNYKFLMFETIPTKWDNGKWTFCDHGWCTGYMSMARYVERNGSYILDEFNADCECGKNDIFREVGIPRFTVLDNEYLILDAFRNSTHTYGCVDCMNTAQFCNGLNLKKSLSFSQGGTRYTRADFNLDSISYTIRDETVYIKSKEDNPSYYDIGELFDLRNEESSVTSQSGRNDWYEDDPDFRLRNDYVVRTLNRPYNLLQDYYDNFISKEKTRDNVDYYEDVLPIHHGMNVVSKERALERDYDDFIDNGIRSYQILVKPSTMVTQHYEQFDFVSVPVTYYVTMTNGERRKFELNINAVLNKENTKIIALDNEISIDDLNEAIDIYNNNLMANSPVNNVATLLHGVSPYSYCYGDENDCASSCSKIVVNTSYESDVIVLVKKNDFVVRNAYIGPGRAFEFNLPNGTYQTFFYFGNSWDNQKYMKETSCGSLYGGFKEAEHFAKDSPQYLNNNVLTYDLQLQNNGNFQTAPSNIEEIF